MLIGDAFAGDNRIRAMGINITGITVVSMSAPILAGVLATGGTFRPFLMFLIGYPLALWASRMPPDSPTRAVDPPLRHLRAAVAVMRRSGRLLDFAGLLTATLAGVFVLHGLGLTVSPLFLDLEFGVPVETRGLIVGTFQLGVILVAARIGRIKARFGATRMLTWAFSLMSVGTAIAAAAPAPWAVALGLTVAGTGFGLFVPLAQAFASEVGGTLHRGLTVLTWVTVVRVAQVVGPPVGSFVTDGAGPRVAFTAAAAAMAGLALLWQPMRRALQTAAASP